MNSKYPLIFDISKGSLADGPGIRTVVFFKGCPLRCLWCHNPESQSPEPEIFYYTEKCISCGNCREGKECCTGARQAAGKFYSPDDIIEIILEDRAYYEVSGGGVTFSGGEPFLYCKYLKEILAGLKKEKINTLVQTCGFFDSDVFESGIFKYIDTVYFDLKIFDPDKHKQYTGVSNEPIINNFIRLLHEDIELLPVIPLIPEYTATEKNITQIHRFLKSHYITGCRLLPYNTAGLDKWNKLGKHHPPDNLEKPMTESEETYWFRFFKNI